MANLSTMATVTSVIPSELRSTMADTIPWKTEPCFQRNTVVIRKLITFLNLSRVKSSKSFSGNSLGMETILKSEQPENNSDDDS